jgi:DNA-binding XRE family transcriptional regulator
LLLGQQLARLRREAGHTQESFARVIGGYARATVADAERGRRNLSRDFWRRCDEALTAHGRLVSAFDEMLVALAADALGKAAGSATAADAPDARGPGPAARGCRRWQCPPDTGGYRPALPELRLSPDGHHRDLRLSWLRPSGPGSSCVKPDIRDDGITRPVRRAIIIIREFVSRATSSGHGNHVLLLIRFAASIRCARGQLWQFLPQPAHMRIPE